MQIIVLGMHRSGTSLTTRLINMMGAYFGPETSVGEITYDNPKGFWERPEVFKLNEAMLASAGCAWNDVSRWNVVQPPQVPFNILNNIKKIVLGMDAFRPWVLKDPRLCLVLPVWRAYLEVPIAVIVHRNPMEIAVSLQKRDEMPIPAGLALWEQYARGIIHSARGMPRIVVQHDEMMKNPVETCHTIHRHLVELGVRRLAMPSDREIKAFIDPKLYRSQAPTGIPGLTPDQELLLNILEEARPFPD